VTAEESARPSKLRRLYLDTSVYLCMLLREQGSEALIRETAGAELLSSVLLILEAKRNLVRLTREGVLDAGQYKECLVRMESDVEFFLLSDVTLDICKSNVMPAIATPRSLDLIHLRTALWFNSAQPIDRFITNDEAQQHAAKELGLPI
jgi:predicted nucleic acid-binding protein